MGEKTSIAWAESTINPLLARLPSGKLGYHCVKVSAECALCYAERFNLRGLPARGTGLPYQKGSTAKVEMVLDPKPLAQLLRWQRPRRVFWCSMTDLFGEFVPPHMIQHCLDVACQAAVSRGHISQLLTKRPEIMVQHVEQWCKRRQRRLPWQVWLGFSAGDRALFFDRWPVMRRLVELDLTEGPVWCSYEPAIGPLVLSSADQVVSTEGHAMEIVKDGQRGAPMPFLRAEEEKLWLGVVDEGLSWLVVGGESGAGRLTRAFDPRWAVDCVRFVGRAGAAVFVKQLGSVWARANRAALGPRDFKAENPASWPEGCRVRNFPEMV